jgi:hypothetical protein
VYIVRPRVHENILALNTSHILQVVPPFICLHWVPVLIVIDHGKDLYEKHGELSQYSQQGFEAGNKRDRHTFEGSTAHFGGKASKVSITLCLHKHKK